MNMGFRQSILVLLNISLFFTIIIGGIGSYFIIQNNNNAKFQYDHTTQPAMYMEEVKSNFWQARALMLQIALDKDPDLIQANYDKILEINERNVELLQRYRDAESSGPEGAKLYALFEQKLQKYQEINSKALLLDLQTSNDHAINEFNTFNNGKLLPVYYEFIEALDNLNGHNLKVAAETNTKSQVSSEKALMIIVGIIIIAVVLMLFGGYFFSNAIMRVVNKVTNFAASIAQKDFDVELDQSLLSRQDEFGTMSRALSTMRSNLVTMIEQLNDTAAKLAASNRTAKKASEYKSFFLARMSHEIRTPLNAIIGMTYIAKRANDPNTVDDCLNKITTSSSHLLGIINDILDISKIEAGKFELVEEEFGLEKLLMNVSTVVSVKTDEKEQNMLITIKNNMPSRFIGDSLRLSQVFTNILNNATKFTPPKGTIHLTASCLEKNSLSSLIEFTIEDTGIGLTEEQISRLFTPFEQAESATSHQFGGTGLGLAICEKIVKLMDGEIKVESEYGKGSRFIITVRLKNSQQVEFAKLDDSVDVQHTKVLIVDESQNVRDFFEHLFHELGILINTAESTDTAYALLQQNAQDNPFNIIFLDWNTAENEGMDFVKRVKQEFGNQVIIVLVSASKFTQIEQKAAEAGVNRFLPKPVFPSTVINLINEVIGTPNNIEPKISLNNVDLSGKHILLVEDNDINREIVFAYLENTDIFIDVAENGVEAVEKYLESNGKYDLVFMDIHMPLMDGYTATKRIREEERNRGWAPINIIALTANAFKEDIERCLAAGMNDHLAKPMDAEKTLDLLQKYLGANKKIQ